jgi:hypothetical protein
MRAALDAGEMELDQAEALLRKRLDAAGAGGEGGGQGGVSPGPEEEEQQEHEVAEGEGGGGGRVEGDGEVRELLNAAGRRAAPATAPPPSMGRTSAFGTGKPGALACG